MKTSTSPYFLLFFIALTIGLGCKKESTPNPEFEVFNNKCHAPCEVSFENNTDGGTAFLWDFDDGNTSEETSPTHIFQNPGTYTVNLTVIDENGEKETSSFVNIYDELGPSALQEDILVYYKFDVGPIIDFSDKANLWEGSLITDEDSPSIVGLSMDAMRSSIHIPAFFSKLNTNQFSISVWVKINEPQGIDTAQYPSAIWRLFSDDEAPGDIAYYLGLSNNLNDQNIFLQSKLRHESYPPGYYDEDINFGLPGIEFDQWHMLTIVQSETVLVYLDGNLVINKPSVSLFHYSFDFDHFRLGGLYTYNETDYEEPYTDTDNTVFLFDNLRIYNRVLDADDVLLIYSIEKK